MKRNTILTACGTFVVGALAGVLVMTNDGAYGAVKGALSGGATSNAVGLNGMTNIQISNMDLESALLAVQQQRASLLENQLKNQIDSVQQRNNEIAQLNSSLNKLTELRYQLKNGKVTLPADLTQTLTTMGFSVPASGIVTQGEIDGLIFNVKSKIDSVGNMQQMDMLRLQSMSNKRNEAFDVMTNFIKKMQDSRSQIIGNMR